MAQMRQKRTFIGGRQDDLPQACRRRGCRAAAFLDLDLAHQSIAPARRSETANTAIGALSALAQLGLSVPDDVSVVGYNDIPIVSRLGTPMTTVRVPFDQIAVAALDLLNHGPDRDQGRIRVATPTLIPRRSTAAPKTK